MTQLEIEVRDDRRELGSIVRSARLHRPDVEPLELWHRFPAELEDLLGEPRADPWLVLSLLPAMRDGLTVTVDGEVDRRLLANLDEYQHAWERRSAARPEGPRYVRVPVEATPVDRGGPVDDALVLGYSGGLDSTFTLVRHATKAAGWATRPLAGAVFAHGFDIDLGDDEVFTSALERARALTDELGVALWPVSTNSRQMSSRWQDCYPSQLAALLHHLAAGAGGALIASGRRWDWLADATDGGSPATDHLLGGDFEVVHDGAGYDRGEKLLALADHPTALRNLRFCWAGDRLDRNCGECRKCVTTTLYFRAVGLEPICFDDPPSDETVRRVLRDAPINAMTGQYNLTILAHAERNGIDEPWVKWVRQRLWRGRRSEDATRVRRAASSAWRRIAPPS